MGLKIWDSPKREDIPNSLQGFLRHLGGPTLIRLGGESAKLCRVLVTLTHGNEPSGVQAVHKWLLAGKRPKTDILILLPSVKAALTAPLFHYRQLPGARDLNRCFSPPYEDEQGELAKAILGHIRDCRPQAVVDLHNTSGPSGPFAVTYNHNPTKEALASLFVEHVIVSHISLGALMEQEPEIPIVTLEAGGAADPASGVMAQRSLEKYFLSEDLFANPLPVMLYHNPLRMELNPPCPIGYSDRPLPDVAVTINKNIESFSFTPVDESNPLGWIERGPEDYFLIRQGNQTLPAEDFFQRDGEGILRPKRKMRLFMATHRPDIAASDCLFYFICE